MSSEPIDALDQIIGRIIICLRQLGLEQHADDLIHSADGASTGTEGLLLMIEYLSKVADESPAVIQKVQEPIDALIRYCSFTGIQLNNTLTRR